MTPKVIAILVILLIVIFGGMALTMKRAAHQRSERIGADPSYSINRCFIA